MTERFHVIGTGYDPCILIYLLFLFYFQLLLVGWWHSKNSIILEIFCDYNQLFSTGKLDQLKPFLCQLRTDIIHKTMMFFLILTQTLRVTKENLKFEPQQTPSCNIKI